MPVSSYTMGLICDWRNPKGAEENWPPFTISSKVGIGTRLLAECGYMVNMIAATVESLASCVIVISLACIFGYDSTICFDSRKYSLNCFFTIKWSFYSLYYNFTMDNLPTKLTVADSYFFNKYLSEENFILQCPKNHKTLTYTSKELFVVYDSCSSLDKEKKDLVARIVSRCYTHESIKINFSSPGEFAQNLYGVLNNIRMDEEKLKERINLYSYFRISDQDLSSFAKYCGWDIDLTNTSLFSKNELPVRHVTLKKSDIDFYNKDALDKSLGGLNTSAIDPYLKILNRYANHLSHDSLSPNMKKKIIGDLLEKILLHDQYNLGTPEFLEKIEKIDQFLSELKVPQEIVVQFFKNFYDVDVSYKYGRIIELNHSDRAPKKPLVDLDRHNLNTQPKKASLYYHLKNQIFTSEHYLGLNQEERVKILYALGNPKGDYSIDNFKKLIDVFQLCKISNKLIIEYGETKGLKVTIEERGIFILMTPEKVKERMRKEKISSLTFQLSREKKYSSKHSLLEAQLRQLKTSVL